MSRLFEDIWGVQDSGAMMCGYGDCYSPGDLLELSKHTAWPPSCCWQGTTATPPCTGKLSCLMGDQGMANLSSLAGNGCVATLTADYVNVTV